MVLVPFLFGDSGEAALTAFVVELLSPIGLLLLLLLLTIQFLFSNHGSVLPNVFYTREADSIHWVSDDCPFTRGEDTRNSFTDHLYAVLRRKGISAFRDAEGLQRGKEISPELLKAIEGSRISIIILSKNYACSTWCLDELAKIVECMETKNQTVFPVFFNVDPSGMGKQKGVFEKVFEKHEEYFREEIERVQKWRAALTRVSHLSGWHFEDGPDRSEAKLIDDIVDEILSRLSPTDSSVIGDLVGIDSRVTELCRHLFLSIFFFFKN